MTDLILVRQTIFVEDFECTVTELVPMYPKLTPCPAPFVKIIARPGISGAMETVIAEGQSRQQTSDAPAVGAGSGRE